MRYEDQSQSTKLRRPGLLGPPKTGSKRELPQKKGAPSQGQFPPLPPSPHKSPDAACRVVERPQHQVARAGAKEPPGGEKPNTKSAREAWPQE